MWLMLLNTIVCMLMLKPGLRAVRILFMASCVVQFLAVLCILLIPVATKPGALLSEKGARGTIDAATQQIKSAT